MQQFHDVKVFNTRFPSFFIPKITVVLTHETRIKDAVNIEDLICLLATVRTLKITFGLYFNHDPHNSQYVYTIQC